MKVLLVSNQVFEDGRVTNPILMRMRDSFIRDERIAKVELMPVDYSFSGMIRIRKAAKQSDIMHIHFGGLYALAVWFFMLGIKTPKLITFHGTDIHAKSIKTAKSYFTKLKILFNQYASFLSLLLFKRVGFVSEEMKSYIPKWLSNVVSKKAFLQPLGVDYHAFQIIEKDEAQKALGLKRNKYVLFSDISNSSIKRRDIAESIVLAMCGRYELLVMSGVEPKLVPLYINAVDFLLLTSDEEGSPNIIRECLALNKPVFSVNVGDAAKQLQGLNNSSIIERDPSVAAETILDKMQLEYIDNTRDSLKDRLNFDCLNESIIKVYKDLIN